jgi:hypothetical protein
VTSFIVYLLCAITSAACAILLLRGYRQSSARLLLWSGLAFAGFTLNNVLLIVDKRVLLQLDLSALRSATVLFGLAFLLYGLIWEEGR